MASNTLTNTKISVTYAGVLHSAGVQLPATGLEYVYDGLGNKSSIRIGRDCSGMTVCGNLSATSLSTSVTLSANQLNIKSLIDLIYPVNSIFLSTTNTNPGTRFIGTTWAQISQGRFLAGQGTGTDALTSFTVPAGNFNGQYVVPLTITAPSHWHGVGVFSGSGNDDCYFIYRNWSELGIPYSARGVFGDSGNNIIAPGITGASYGVGTSDAISEATTQNVNNIPPGFGVYVWKRTA